MEVKLTDCYTLSEGKALMSGTEALVRLLLEQSRIDRMNGLRTKGLVSGYPGSPLGGLDIALGKAKSFLDEEGIYFQPAVNEELAATALWGSQHINLYDNPSIQGVFSMWYGKGPGLDRAMDALRHANQGGVAPHGGMVIAVGDDPTGKSSTLAYQSDQNFHSLGIPYFFPKNVSEIIPMGLEAFALSRYSGCCVGLKIVVDTADSNAVVDMSRLRPNFPKMMPNNLVHVTKHDPAGARESKLHEIRLPEVQKWCAKSENAVQIYRPAKKGKTRLGIIGVGKIANEINEALITLLPDGGKSNTVAFTALNMPWPLPEQSLSDMLSIAEEVLVIEEKRSFVEDQIAKICVKKGRNMLLSGKTSPDGENLLPSYGEISLENIINVIAERASHHSIELNPLKKLSISNKLDEIPVRQPYYCAGCPHNSSTKASDGEIVGMGIGCHSISGFINPDTITNFTQMGGEGAFWIGRAPFSERTHSFQNMGDGTYAHSGYLGVRAAVAAGVNITFKMLVNDAVAMTGGQSAQGGSSPFSMTEQLLAEGVKKVVIVSDQPDQIRKNARWPVTVDFFHRDKILKVQDELSQIKGVSALLHVQTCATELRRRRKRKTIPQRSERIYINAAVCEGCGDCAKSSNCVALKPKFDGEAYKRVIDQSVCNDDYSCLDGFCPSFVAVVPSVGNARKKIKLPENVKLPDPVILDKEITNIYLAGIGGTGISTLSAVLVMAARLDDIYAQAVSQTGLSQKNGAVTSQIRITKSEDLSLRMSRIPDGEADLLLACDAVVGVADNSLKTLSKNKSQAIINIDVDPVGVVGFGNGATVPEKVIFSRLEKFLDSKKFSTYNIQQICESLMGNKVTANVMMLGIALQKGMIPISVGSVEKALPLNGASVQDNLIALEWGRWLAYDKQYVLEASGYNKISSINNGLENAGIGELLNAFSEKLILYQDANYAKHYRKIMDAVSAQFGDTIISQKSAKALFRAMAIKDEYEVARLMLSPTFEQTLKSKFGNSRPSSYYLAPPFLSFLKDANGFPRKVRFGSWVRTIFWVLTKLKSLRGTAFDPFAHSRERKLEVSFRAALIAKLSNPKKLMQMPEELEAQLDAALKVKGYGHVKQKSLEAAILALN